MTKSVRLRNTGNPHRLDSDVNVIKYRNPGRVDIIVGYGEPSSPDDGAVASYEQTVFFEDRTGSGRLTHCAIYVSAENRLRYAEAVAPEGHVVVPRDRYERLLVAAESAHESVNAPYDPSSEGGGELWANAEQALVRAAGALQPGDLDPLPTDTDPLP